MSVNMFFHVRPYGVMHAYVQGYACVCAGLRIRTCRLMRMYVKSYTFRHAVMHLTYTENGCYFSRLVTKYVVIFSYSLLNRLSIFAFSN